MNKKLYQQIFEYVPYNDREFNDRNVMLDYIKNNKDVLTRNNKICHMTVSAWIVNKDRTKVLMIFHNIYDSWSYIGGHADGEEDLLCVIKKEIEEESGLKHAKLLTDKIYGLNILTSSNHVKKGNIVNSHLHFNVEYLFEADAEEMLRIKEDENSGVKWININEVEKYTTEEEMKPIYKNLVDKLKNME